MENYERYIPREYLALKINYCRKQLSELPVIKVYNHTANGESKNRLIVGSHRYEFGTAMWQKYQNIMLMRQNIEQRLKIYDSIWDYNFRFPPLSECKPDKVNRTLFNSNNEPVLLDKAFFDSLKNDSNDIYAKNKNYYFNGTYYRSASERDIAILYTQMGIPFKYEPEISLAGLFKPVHTDFVLYIKEIDNCKFHEHFGIKDSADYQRITKIKYGNYSGAGLLPGIDILYTHDTDEAPFDIRSVISVLNSAIYGTILTNKS